MFQTTNQQSNFGGWIPIIVPDDFRTRIGQTHHVSTDFQLKYGFPPCQDTTKEIRNQAQLAKPRSFRWGSE